MSGSTPSEIVARRIIAVCTVAGMLACAAAVFLRIGSQWWPWAMQMRLWIGMALHTAMALLLLHAGLWALNRWPERRGARTLAWVAAGLTTVVSLIVLARQFAPVPIEFEQWLVRALMPQADKPGHMSLHTGLTFLAAAGALMGLLRARGRAMWWRRAAFTLAVLVFCSGLLAALGFAVGTPMIYGRTFSTMKWLTALVSAAFAVAAMFAAYPDNWILQALLERPTATPSAPTLKFRRGLAFTLVFLTTGLGLVGFYFLRKEQANLRERVHQELAMMAELKAAWVTDWRNDHLAQGRLIMGTPFVARRAQEFFLTPRAPGVRETFLGWLGRLMARGRYSQVLLLDQYLNLRLVHPEGSPAQLTDVEAAAVRDAWDAQKVLLTPLHRPGDDPNGAQLSLVVPLRLRALTEGQDPGILDEAAAPESARVGLLVLRLDAASTLFPRIRYWPGLSQTAEAFLIQCDERGTVCASELRFETNAPLRLRSPLDRDAAALVRVDPDEPRVLKGADYRVVTVLAAIEPIPDSPWLMVAKMDEAEIYAPVRERGLVLGVMLAVLMLGVALGANLLWRQRDLEFLRHQMAAERERYALAQRLAHVMKSANDILVLADDQWRVVEMNDRGLETYGWRPDETTARSFAELFAPEALSEFQTFDQQLRRAGQLLVETQHRRADGRAFPVEVSARRVELNGVPYTLAVIRDVSERKRLEQQLVEVSDREQARIGQDLHDGLGQMLVTLGFDLRRLEDRLTTRGLPEAALASQAAALLDQAITEARGVARGLLAVQLGGDGLAQALRNLAATVNARHSVRCTVECPDSVPLPDNTAATHLFRIAQEAVNNALKHARPRHVTIRVVVTRQQIDLTVTDDGQGLVADAERPRGMGLHIMEYRARALNARFQVKTSARGTRVWCSVPLDSLQRHAPAEES
jgi:PAS domain S-box-containing protein